MSTTKLTVGLPDRLAKEVGEAGFLVPNTFARVMREALRRQAFDDLIEIARRPSDIPPMTTEEIQVEVDAARARIREREKHEKR